jgi:hypothetical protein
MRWIVGACVAVGLALLALYVVIPQMQVPSAEEIAWRNAMDAGSPEAIMEFINKFPKSRYIRDALAKMDHFIDKQAAREAWGIAIRLDDVHTWRRFLKDYPTGKAGEMARKRIEELEAPPRIRTDPLGKQFKEREKSVVLPTR